MFKLSPLLKQDLQLQHCDNFYDSDTATGGTWRALVRVVRVFGLDKGWGQGQRGQVTGDRGPRLQGLQGTAEHGPGHKLGLVIIVRISGDQTGGLVILMIIILG